MIRALAAGALVTLVAGSAGWKPAAPLPLARSEVAAAAYGTGIVVVGGYLAGGTGKNTARADLYLPRQNRWRRLPDYPLAIDHAAAVGAGRRAYVVGGFANRGDQVRVGYSLENGRWRRLPTLPAARAASGAALIGSKLYVVGGFAGEKLAQTMLVLDLSSRRWSSAPGPTPRDHLGVTALAGRIYAVGGERSEPGQELALVESWAPGERRWTRLPPISAGSRRRRRGGHGWRRHRGGRDEPAPPIRDRPAPKAGRVYVGVAAVAPNGPAQPRAGAHGRPPVCDRWRAVRSLGLLGERVPVAALRKAAFCRKFRAVRFVSTLEGWSASLQPWFSWTWSIRPGWWRGPIPRSYAAG